MSPHVTPDVAERYRAKTLDPAELIAVCDHLDACESCRQALEARMLPPLHATYEDLVDTLHGAPSAGTSAHLESCAVCRADLDALRIARQNLAAPPRRRAWWPVWGVAFAAALTAAFVLLRDPMPALQIPPALAELRPRGGVLLGDDTAPGFHVLSPIATLVAEDRPVFRWEPQPQATAYRIEVFDPDFNPVASGDTAATEWTPSAPLPRSVILRWRVLARTPAGEIAAPVPPEPEARFRILDAATAAQWDTLRARHSGKRLAIEAANLGLRQEALRLDPALPELKW